MAIDHSTETALPVLESLIDAVDESVNLNAAFECYHQMVTSYVLRTADVESSKETAARFVHGLNILFYSTLLRAEHLGDFLQKASHIRDAIE
ncbi:hypothetical protein ALP36_200180 [Pseudomonas syringae pv. coriandricola]|uniref:Uncharacterized protein n=1 Tax=Pseudomonas syringae pv. coriandricola TaxID=264453 RepID=A0A3M5QXN8_9PSED|nr:MULTISPECIES: hypothetical protein [Pseudomonas syringae group]MBI6794978.1 hypothetical protein [Pseudomonas syringae]RMU01248.1 hypothetical protein ALP36_200180 [Pseudomonas syringae pv. coriandricola]